MTSCDILIMKANVKKCQQREWENEEMKWPEMTKYWNGSKHY
jgi:hypothetical protein